MLSQKLAVVTGGGSGIGRAICETFAKEGASIVIADVNKGNADQTHGLLSGPRDRHLSVQADVSSSEFVKQLVDIVQSKFGRPADIVVNNAGVTKDAMLFKLNEEAWDWVQSVNLKGPFLMTQAFAHAMINAKLSGGSIINMSSISGKIGNVGQANYASSKGGLISFTKTVARELAKNNIRCNAVLPGYIDTPMTGKIPVKVSEAVIAQIPLGRMGKAQDVANTCLFLASDLSSYLTGTCVEVTGGLGM